MNVDIKKIRDRGDIDRERLVLEVHADDDIGRYVVFVTDCAEDGGVSNRLKRAYWFPDKPVGEGDLVVLYTKAGNPKIKRNEDGTRSHFFYLGLEKPIWSVPSDYAVLLQARNWQALEVSAQ